MDKTILFKLFEKATTAIFVFQEEGGIYYANPSAISILHTNKHQLDSLDLEHFFPVRSNQDLFSQLKSYHKSFIYRNATLQPRGFTPTIVDLSVQTLSRSSQGRRISQFNIYPLSKTTHPPKQSKPTTDTVPLLDTAELLKVLRKQTDMPLHALDSLLHRLLQMQPRSDQLPFLHSMLQSGAQLRTNLQDILLYTDLIYGKYSPKPEVPFRPEQLLQALKNKYQEQADKRGNSIAIDTTIVSESYYAGNEEALELMLSKLMDNALRFTRNSQIKLLIREEDREAEKVLLTFSIEDKGTGMSPDKLEQATKPFISWKPPWEPENQHSGLGLSIVQLLARSCDGQLNLQSQAGSTQADIMIPCKVLNGNKQATPSIRERDDQALKGLRLLYVEDLQPNHFLMESLCSIWQISLDTAYNGKEALSKFYKNPYDVVLMDLNMPLMNGYDASLRIRQSSDAERQHVPIIAVTGSVNTDKAKTIQEYGINDILTKPIKPEELYQKLTYFTGL